MALRPRTSNAMERTSVKAARLRLGAALTALATAVLAPVVATAQPIGVLPAGPPECGELPPRSCFRTRRRCRPSTSASSRPPIVVSGAGTYLWDVGVITELTHSRSSDLSVTLTSPAGTVVTLTSGNGGPNANVFDGTVWDDQSNPAGQVPYGANDGLVTDHTYQTGVTATPLAPEEALGAFVGEDPNGIWTLRVGDVAAGQGGTLGGWSLSLATLPNAPSVLGHLRLSSSTVVPILDNATATSTIDVPAGIGSRDLPAVPRSLRRPFEFGRSRRHSDLAVRHGRHAHDRQRRRLRRRLRRNALGRPVESRRPDPVRFERRPRHRLRLRQRRLRVDAGPGGRPVRGARREPFRRMEPADPRRRGGLDRHAFRLDAPSHDVFLRRLVRGLPASRRRARRRDGLRTSTACSSPGKSRTSRRPGRTPAPRLSRS